MDILHLLRESQIWTIESTEKLSIICIWVPLFTVSPLFNRIECCEKQPNWLPFGDSSPAVFWQQSLRISNRFQGPLKFGL